MTTTIKSYKNEYGHDVIKCPFCEYVAWVRKITRTNTDPIRDLKRHITNQAKNEALDVQIQLDADIKEFAHLMYFKTHTSEKKVIQLAKKRTYDADLQLEK